MTGLTSGTGSVEALPRPTDITEQRGAALLLLMLLSADLALLLLHIIGQTLGRYSAPLRAAGLYEHILVYQLVKLSWIILLLACLLFATRFRGYLAWMLVFGYLFLDKALEIHQRIGDYIANNTALPLEPRLYQLAVMLLAGAFLFALVGFACFRGPAAFRRISRDLFLLVVAWVSFGLVTDLAAALGLGPGIEFASDFVEDGGEMLVVSLILWYVYRLAVGRGSTPVASSPSS